MSQKQRKVSKERIKQEILKCGRDPVYFLKNYAKIVHQKYGEIPFNTYDFQDELLRDFKDYRFNVILKARQLGISTITAGYISWLILFQRHKEVIVMATKQEKAKNILNKVKLILERLPDWLQIAKPKIDNRNSLKLTNGSRVGAESTAKDAGRSDSLALLVIDEAAHVENMDEIWTAVYPTVSTGGRVIALSTPMGVGSWFHKVCTDAQNNKNDFHLTTLMWDVHPDRDQKWFEKETRNMSERDIAQEYLCSFNASGDTVVNPSDIERLKKDITEPKYYSGFDRNFWIWEEFKPEFNYVITCDVARGDGEDYSTVQVLKIEDMEQVAEYCGKASPDIFIDFIESVGNDYGQGLLVIENNNIGFTVASELMDRNYPNLYFSRKSTHEYIEPFQAIGNSQAVPGLTTSLKTRPLIIAKLEEYIRNESITVRSSRFCNELDTFIWVNGRPQAAKGYNDDLVMSMAFACWVRETALIKNVRAIEYNKAVLNSIIISRTPIETRMPGMPNMRHTGRNLEIKLREQQKQFQHTPWIFKG